MFSNQGGLGWLSCNKSIVYKPKIWLIFVSFASFVGLQAPMFSYGKLGDSSSSLESHTLIVGRVW